MIKRSPPNRNWFSLETAPSEREAILNEGRWIVYCFATYSAPDRKAVGKVLDLALALSENDSDIRMAVRPFLAHAEFQTWVPEVKETYRSPVWVFMEDGNVVRVTAGSHSLNTIPLMYTAHVYRSCIPLMLPVELNAEFEVPDPSGRR